MTVEAGMLSRAQYAAIAAFRARLRRFLAFSEAAAGAEGLAPQQHQALLALAGYAGDEAPGVGAVAEALMIAPHSAAELVARMVDAGLLRKDRSVRDRRKVDLTLTEKAETLLHRLTAAHLAELKALEPALADALGIAGRASG
jgi:DNA-binding MarR family transcriptional regulator